MRDEIGGVSGVGGAIGTGLIVRVCGLARVGNVFSWRGEGVFLG